MKENKRGRERETERGRDTHMYGPGKGMNPETVQSVRLIAKMRVRERLREKERMKK